MSVYAKKNPFHEPEAPGFRAARMLEVEISHPLPDVTAFTSEGEQKYQRAICLVRLHTRPLGVIELQLDEQGLSAANFARRIWATYGAEISAHLRQDGLEQIDELSAGGIPTAVKPGCRREQDQLLSTAPPASIIVATRDRPESLATCVDSLLCQDYHANYEIVVVDNAPNTTATADLIRQRYLDTGRVHYVREDHPGLAIAHNRGLRQVQGDIVAFTDDDVVADRYWLRSLVAGFYAAENVACVTGMIHPIELKTPAQAWIEQFGGFGKGFARRLYNTSTNRPLDPLYPYTAGMFGSGANMAFTRSFLRESGGFDPALGAGSGGVGGDDLAAFFEVIARSFTLVYEPAAIVHHRHRRDYTGLRRQAHGYGVGLTAYLMKILVDKPWRLLDLAIRVPHGLLFLLNSRSTKNVKKLSDYPKELTRIERKGMLHGPLAYLRSRRRAKKMNLYANLGGSRVATASAPAARADEVH